MPRQSTSVPEEARAVHWRNILLRFALAFNCGSTETEQNRLVYHLRDKNNQQKRRFLSEKLQDVRDKQKKRNTTPRMKSVVVKIVTAQLMG